MNRILQMAIFFAMFSSIYGIMNYHVYSRMSRTITYAHLGIIILVLALSFPVVSILERFVDGPVLGWIYFGSMTWVGTSFFLLIAYSILDISSIIFRSIIKTSYATAGAVVIALVIAIVIYSIIEARNLTIKHIDVPVDSLKKEIRIVQLSDIHVGTIHKEKFLQKIVDAANSQDPDIIVITGDLFDGSGPLTDDMLSPLKKLKSPVYFITGNHENYLGKEKAVELVKKNNITVLENESVKIKGIQLIGIPNPVNETDRRTDKLDGINLSKNMTKVVLYHLPIFQKGADLQLSGHTHNGQIYPFTLLVKIMFQEAYGLFSHDESYMYVTSGIGTWGPPMRFFSPSEIVVIDLKKKQ